MIFIYIIVYYNSYNNKLALMRTLDIIALKKTHITTCIQMYYKFTI